MIIYKQQNGHSNFWPLALTLKSYSINSSCSHREQAHSTHVKPDCSLLSSLKVWKHTQHWLTSIITVTVTTHRLPMFGSWRRAWWRCIWRLFFHFRFLGWSGELALLWSLSWLLVLPLLFAFWWIFCPLSFFSLLIFHCSFSSSAWRLSFRISTYSLLVSTLGSRHMFWLQHTELNILRYRSSSEVIHLVHFQTWCLHPLGTSTIV